MCEGRDERLRLELPRKCSEHTQQLEQDALLDLQVDRRKIRQRRHFPYAVSMRRKGELLWPDHWTIRHLREVAQHRSVVGIERLAELLQVSASPCSTFMSVRPRRAEIHLPLVHIIQLEWGRFLDTASAIPVVLGHESKVESSSEGCRVQQKGRESDWTAGWRRREY